MSSCKLCVTFINELCVSPITVLTCPAQVDYTGFSTINAQRFGQKFVGRVANPHDLLLFTKAASRKEPKTPGMLRLQPSWACLR